MFYFVPYLISITIPSSLSKCPFQIILNTEPWETIVCILHLLLAPPPPQCKYQLYRDGILLSTFFFIPVPIVQDIICFSNIASDLSKCIYHTVPPQEASLPCALQSILFPSPKSWQLQVFSLLPVCLFQNVMWVESYNIQPFHIDYFHLVI